jgi:protein SCO1/2
MTPRFRLLGAALCGVAALLAVGAALLWRHSMAPADLLTGTYIAPARALPDFSLIDQQGRAFGPERLKGRWSLVFFGYTNCPDFCPTTLTILAGLEKRLRAARAAVRPQVIFVSVDAKRDTPAQLARYVPYFDPEFIGVTAADQRTIESFAAQLGVAVVLTPRPDGSYTVDHSGAIFVVDPAGKLAAVLTGPFNAGALQTDFQHIAAAHG